jgi:hypothetical protein
MAHWWMITEEMVRLSGLGWVEENAGWAAESGERRGGARWESGRRTSALGEGWPAHCSVGPSSQSPLIVRTTWHILRPSDLDPNLRSLSDGWTISGGDRYGYGGPLISNNFFLKNPRTIP